MLYSASRAVIDLLRGDLHVTYLGMTSSQLAAAGIFIPALAVYCLRASYLRPGRDRKGK
jgi:hypothetical protein